MCWEWRFERVGVKTRCMVCTCWGRNGFERRSIAKQWLDFIITDLFYWAYPKSWFVHLKDPLSMLVCLKFASLFRPYMFCTMLHQFGLEFWPGLGTSCFAVDKIGMAFVLFTKGTLACWRLWRRCWPGIKLQSAQTAYWTVISNVRWTKEYKPALPHTGLFPLNFDSLRDTEHYRFVVRPLLFLVSMTFI